MHSFSALISNCRWLVEAHHYTLSYLLEDGTAFKPDRASLNMVTAKLN
jgi:hypothetical protein